ncbi:ABC transporter C-terminal domain-containing protein [Nocardia sp. NPDC051756]|uniref:ABC transporter C-terminal domain-containing protein n=1 Tax=Nocardia sp. NPDC051756 TaxID=3154751 RepID=UPI00344A801E
MALYVTEWSITSDASPECASRITHRGRPAWRLSWLPDRILTLEQARAGMELDELLSDPENVNDYAAMARADVCAGTIGMLRAHVVILLARRMAARLPVALKAS